ncbi:polyribonucleotide nucleotidyltransferase [Yaniella halotolerans]|uniref:polyribonucleotide nucleotidyltransferase n=1 Tax=Yaniella halotolerans TaxID=225453 RepID=UPI0003B74286|nr:polyribonucleotide nucleotidyltransferase [Yaniella halotolerans]
MEGPEIQFAEAVIDNGKYGTRTVRFETGRLAKQAAGATLVTIDEETSMLSTTTFGKNPREGFDFFPLTVDVEERQYAAGKIPGSFFRREARPPTDAILTARLIDRPLRPAFADGIRNEVQVVVTVTSIAADEVYDTVAINAASMSTTLSGMDFAGPIGAVRIALIADENGETQWVAFPKYSQLQNAVFNMAVAGRMSDDGDIAVMMVEAEAPEGAWEMINGKGVSAPTEEIVADGLEAAKPFIKVLCDSQADLADRAAKAPVEIPRFVAFEQDAFDAVKDYAGTRLAEIFSIADKQEREAASDEYHQEVVEALAGEGKPYAERQDEIVKAYGAVTRHIVRQRVLTEQVRIDGRGLTDIRQLTAEVEVLPRVHGSAIFERGETQIMGVTTLNMLKMEQQLDSLSPETSKRYMHHYNFPPYSVGETGRVGSPKRREIGHGALAERAILPVLPSREEFPYAIRQVSEALASNGSTSMGSVCASTLSLFNSGVPLRASVAGIAMGLVSDTVNNETRYAALTDILGAEDAMGDMDFKVAGTKDFITAIQLDTKLDGIPADVLAAALTQAREARLHILSVMDSVIDEADDMSPTAPRILSVKIPVDKIGEVIGPKGKMINQIQEDTGADISIEDDGTVLIGSAEGKAAEEARDTINAIANPQVPEAGERYLGTVVKTTSFGAFISLTPGKDGLLHISELRKLNDGKRVDEVDDIVAVGSKLQVEIAKVDDRGKLSLVPVIDEDGEEG